MLDTDGAIGQNIRAVDYCTFIVIVVLISSELLKHFNLVHDRVHQVLILCISRIAWIQLDCHIECLFGCCHFAKSQVRLKQPLVYSWECCIKSDTGLAVFDGLSVHFQVDVAHCAIGENLDAWLYAGRLGVESDRGAVI